MTDMKTAERPRALGSSDFSTIPSIESAPPDYSVSGIYPKNKR